ncbi:MAG: hypothetical protein JKY27_07760, partial [Magnetovibrio sp.]|nr:hypothetical protein [Magnetovibrio sp.]
MIHQQPAASAKTPAQKKNLDWWQADGAGLEHRSLEGGAFVPLDDPTRLWRVTGGGVDIFAVPQGDEERPASRTFLFHVPQDGVLLPLKSQGDDLGDDQDVIQFVGVGWQQTTVTRVPLPSSPDDPLDAASASKLSPKIEAWTKGLSEGVARFIVERGTPSTYAATGETICATAGERMTARRSIVWAHITSGRARFKDIVPVGPGQVADIVPLTRRSWMHCDEDMSVTGYTTQSVLRGQGWWTRLQRYHDVAVGCLAYSLRHAHDRETQRLGTMFERVKSDTTKVLNRFALVLDEDGDRRADLGNRDATVLACDLVAEAIGVELKALDKLGRRSEDAPITVEDVARVSRLRVRQVMLSGDWWDQDLGPILAHMDDDEHPVALIKPSRGRSKAYVAHNPANQTSVVMDGEQARRITPMGYVLYAPLPERKLTLIDLLRFGFLRNRSDFMGVLSMGAAGGLIGLATP